MSHITAFFHKLLDGAVRLILFFFFTSTKIITLCFRKVRSLVSSDLLAIFIYFTNVSKGILHKANFEFTLYALNTNL